MIMICQYSFFACNKVNKTVINTSRVKAGSSTIIIRTFNTPLHQWKRFPGGSDGKDLPVMRETWVLSLGWKDLLEKEMATRSSILAWKISWTEEPGRLQSMTLQRVRHDCATSLSLSFHLHQWIDNPERKSAKNISLKHY